MDIVVFRDVQFRPGDRPAIRVDDVTGERNRLRPIDDRGGRAPHDGRLRFRHGARAGRRRSFRIAPSSGAAASVATKAAPPAASSAAAANFSFVMNMLLAICSLKATADAETVPAATARPATIAMAALTVPSNHADGTTAAVADRSVRAEAIAPTESTNPRRASRWRKTSRPLATRPRTVPSVQPSCRAAWAWVISSR